jgi:hypothetical protein
MLSVEQNNDWLSLLPPIIIYCSTQLWMFGSALKERFLNIFKRLNDYLHAPKRPGETWNRADWWDALYGILKS